MQLGYNNDLVINSIPIQIDMKTVLECFIEPPNKEYYPNITNICSRYLSCLVNLKDKNINFHNKLDYENYDKISEIARLGNTERDRIEYSTGALDNFFTINKLIVNSFNKIEIIDYINTFYDKDSTYIVVLLDDKYYTYIKNTNLLDLLIKNNKSITDNVIYGKFLYVLSDDKYIFTEESDESVIKFKNKNVNQFLKPKDLKIGHLYKINKTQNHIYLGKKYVNNNLRYIFIDAYQINTIISDYKKPDFKSFSWFRSIYNGSYIKRFKVLTEYAVSKIKYNIDKNLWNSKDIERVNNFLDNDNGFEKIANYMEYFNMGVMIFYSNDYNYLYSYWNSRPDEYTLANDFNNYKETIIEKIDKKMDSYLILDNIDADDNITKSKAENKKKLIYKYELIFNEFKNNVTGTHNIANNGNKIKVEFKYIENFISRFYD